jgi:hypothetical protein
MEELMRRPALSLKGVNTVFNTKLVDANSGTTKNQFNATAPSLQRTAFGGKFRTNIITTLTNINGCLDLQPADQLSNRPAEPAPGRSIGRVRGGARWSCVAGVGRAGCIANR